MVQKYLGPVPERRTETDMEEGCLIRTVEENPRDMVGERRTHTAYRTGSLLLRLACAKGGLRLDGRSAHLHGLIHHRVLRRLHGAPSFRRSRVFLEIIIHLGLADRLRQPTHLERTRRQEVLGRAYHALRPRSASAKMRHRSTLRNVSKTMDEMFQWPLPGPLNQKSTVPPSNTDWALPRIPSYISLAEARVTVLRLQITTGRSGLRSRKAYCLVSVIPVVVLVEEAGYEDGQTRHEAAAAVKCL
jgi:hypothetical protein